MGDWQAGLVGYHGFLKYFRSVLRRKPKLKVLLISQEGTLAHKEFESAYAKYGSDRIEFRHKQVGVDDLGLAEVIKSVGKNYDAVFLLSKVGGQETASAILSLNVPFYAVGEHSSAVERVADGLFPSPSIAGEELGKIVSLAPKRLRKRKIRGSVKVILLILLLWILFGLLMS